MKGFESQKEELGLEKIRYLIADIYRELRSYGKCQCR